MTLPAIDLYLILILYPRFLSELFKRDSQLIYNPFVIPEIKKEKSKRSGLEAIFRKNQTPQNETNFKEQSKVVSKLISADRRTYFRNPIATCSQQPRKLWKALDNLLHRKPPPSLPNTTCPSSLASLSAIL